MRYRAALPEPAPEAALPNALDLVVVASITVLWPVWENAIAWPRFVRDVARNPEGERVAGYRLGIATQWAVSLFALAAWIARGHDWSRLAFVAAPGWRLWLGGLLAAGMVVFMAQQVASVHGNAAARAAVRRQVGDLEPLMPRTSRDLPWFLGLSVTAGICEEWLYRGVLTALLAGWIGLPLAVAASCVAFGLGHAYQGPAGVLRTAAIGLVFSGIVLGSGSLLPAMVVHATVDVGSGVAAFLALRGRDEGGAEGSGDAGGGAGA